MPGTFDSIVVGAAKVEEEKEDRQMDESMKYSAPRAARP